MDTAAVDMTATTSPTPRGDVFRGSAIALTARVAGVAVSLLTGIVTARMLGPDGKGALAYLSAASALVVRAGSLGMDGSFAHFYLARRVSLAECLGSVMWITATAGIASV